MDYESRTGFLGVIDKCANCDPFSFEDMCVERLERKNRSTAFTRDIKVWYIADLEYAAAFTKGGNTSCYATE